MIYNTFSCFLSCKSFHHFCTYAKTELCTLGPRIRVTSFFRGGVYAESKLHMRSQRFLVLQRLTQFSVVGSLLDGLFPVNKPTTSTCTNFGAFNRISALEHKFRMER